MKRLILLFASALCAWGQGQVFPPASGGGGGSGTVTSVATGCGTSGGTFTTSGTVIASEAVRTQTGTSDTFLDSDCGKLVTDSSASAVAVTLPQANGSTFKAGWFVDRQNRGAGTVTITPATSTIDGAASLTLLTGDGVRIVSDGTNYFTVRGRLRTLLSVDIPNNAANTSGSAATLATPRAIYGNNFDGSAALTQIVASTFGGTGNGFTKFTGPTTSEKTFTLPDSSVTLLYGGGPGGTPSSLTLTNATGLPAASVVAGTFGAGNYTVNGNLTIGTSVSIDGTTGIAATAKFQWTVNALVKGGGAGVAPIITGITVDGSNNISTPGTGTFGAASGVSGKWTANGSTSGSAAISVPAAAGTPNDLLLPTSTGSNGQCIMTNGANPQQLSWTACSSTIANYYTSGTATGIGQASFTPTGTLYLYDPTASTGVTTVTIRSGAGQSSTNNLQFLTSGGTVTGQFTFDGLAWGSNSGAFTITGVRNTGGTAGVVFGVSAAPFSTDSSLFAFNGNAQSSFAGTGNDMAAVILQANFSPSASGTGTASQLRLHSTVNQTGSSTGIIRGFDSKMTITAATDYRSLSLRDTSTITGTVADGQNSAIFLEPTYTAATAQTVTRHDYIWLNNPTLAGAGPAALTDATVFRFDAAAGTHKAVDSGTTKTTPGGVDAWMKININGTIYYIPAYTSKAS